MTQTAVMAPPFGQPSALANTVVAGGVPEDAAQTRVRDTRVSAGTSMPAAASAVRTTILPRVRLIDNRPELEVEGKLRFEELRRLGEGGLGEVVGAHDHDIGRKVAIKRLKADIRSPAALARFVDEVRTIGKLEHPNIVPIHDVGVDDTGNYYFVMKYVDGETLESVIERLRARDPATMEKYTVERRVEIFRALLEAVAFAHDHGIVHRDIKPANVMVGRYGEVILMDWGIAKWTQSASGGDAFAASGLEPTPSTDKGRAFETQVGTLVGTPLYMAPEQTKGAVADARTDIYALSVLFHEMLYLEHYLANKTSLYEVLEGVNSVDPPFNSPVTVPAELRWFLRPGLEKDPNKRYPSARAMIDALDRRADGCIDVHCPVTLTKSVGTSWMKQLDKHPWMVLSLILTFALTFLGLLGFTILTLARGA